MLTALILVRSQRKYYGALLKYYALISNQLSEYEKTDSNLLVFNEFYIDNECANTLFAKW